MGTLGHTAGTIADIFNKAQDADRQSQTADEQKALYTIFAKKLTAGGLASTAIITGTSQEPVFGNTILPDATSNAKPVVLLWARYTGTNTAIVHNPDGDSCVQGQIQITIFSSHFNSILLRSVMVREALIHFERNRTWENSTSKLR